MAQPMISVIVPIYGVEAFLPACLDSLLAQRYAHYELILVNDGSPDNSWRVMQEYAAKDSRVRIFQKENGGVSSARNFGLAQAQGEYITFVDPDDTVDPLLLSLLLKAAENCNMSMARCGWQAVAEGESVLAVEEDGSKPICVQLADYSCLSRRAISCCWGVLYSAELLLGMRFDEMLYYGEDTLFVMQALKKAGAFASLELPLYHYVQHSTSFTKQRFSMRQYSEIASWEKIGELVQDGPAKLRRSVQVRTLEVYAHVYYRMAHSEYSNAEMEKVILQKLRCKWPDAFLMRHQCLRERGKVWMLILCPRLARALWRVGKRMKRQG